MPISIIFPTRKRPQNISKLVQSLHATCKTVPQVCVYIDDDDDQSAQMARELAISYIQAPRQQYLSNSWNAAAKLATGDILMYAGDDLVFRTIDWDLLVEEEFAKSKDKIILVHGDDKCHGRDRAATHGFLHHRWVETLGYLFPPFFESWADNWITDVANSINRRVYIPIVTEHRHWTTHPDVKKDEVYEEARVKQPNDVKKFRDSKEQRIADSNKLRALLNYIPVPGNPSTCPKCTSLCIVPISGVFRCNQCGHQFPG